MEIQTVMDVMEDDEEFLNSFDLDMFLVKNPELREELESHMCSIHIRNVEGILIRKYLNGFMHSKLESGEDIGDEVDEFIDLETFHQNGLVNHVDDLWKIANCGFGSTRISRDDLKDYPHLEYFPFVIFDINKTIQVGESIKMTFNQSNDESTHIRYPLDSKFMTIIEKSL